MTNPFQLDRFLDKLKSIFDKSPEGMVISDMTRKDEPIIYCNDTFLEITGYNRDEIVGKNCRFLQREDTQQMGLQLLRAAVKSSQSCRVVLRNYTKDGSLFYNRLSLFPVEDEHGHAHCYIGIQDDITSLVTNRKYISKLKEEKQALVSEVHHRVKNNMAVVSSLLDLEMNSEMPSLALEKSRMRIDSMSTIHENVYNQEGFARVDFDKVIRSLHDYHRQDKEEEEREEQPDLHYIMDTEKVTLNINQAIPLSMIFSELLHNVYGHAYESGESGKVRVKLDEPTEDTVLLEVTDDGQGVTDFTKLYQPETMGYNVIHTLVQQLNADLLLNNAANGFSGLSVQVTFEKSDRPGSYQATAVQKKE